MFPVKYILLVKLPIFIVLELPLVPIFITFVSVPIDKVVPIGSIVFTDNLPLIITLPSILTVPFVLCMLANPLDDPDGSSTKLLRIVISPVIVPPVLGSFKSAYNLLTS